MLKKILTLTTMITVVGATGFTLVQASEGYYPTPYKDPVGIWTVCWGHTGPDVIPGQTWSRPRCEAVFNKDVMVAVDGLNACLQKPLNANQAAALVSFTFNVGVPRACSSTLVKMVNSGDYEGAGREFSRWVKGSVNGRTIVLRGLVKRRTAEYTLWNTPVTSATQTINIEALKKLTKE